MNKIITLFNKHFSFIKWLQLKLAKNFIYLGFIRAYSIPTLPPKLELFYTHIFVKILRIIGGFSCVLVITKTHLMLPSFLHLFLAIVASFQMTQIMIILTIKFFYGLYTLIYKKEKFEIRNSPLNRYASLMSKALYCMKLGCSGTAGGAGFIAGGAAYDSILEASGRDPVFVPFMGKAFNTVFGEGPNNKVTSNIKNTISSVTPNTQDQESVTEVLKKYHQMSPKERDEFMDEIKKENNKD